MDMIVMTGRPAPLKPDDFTSDFIASWFWSNQPILQTRNIFMFKQKSLGLNATAKTCQRIIGPDDPMAGHDDGEVQSVLISGNQKLADRAIEITIPDIELRHVLTRFSNYLDKAQHHAPTDRAKIRSLRWHTSSTRPQPL